MAPPPHRNPSPPTARSEAASEPDLSVAEANGRAGSSASSSMPLPPAEAKTAGAEGCGQHRHSVGVSSALDAGNASGASSSNTVTASRSPYAIPEWSAAPSHPFCLEVLKDEAISDRLDLSKKEAYMFGRSPLCDFVLLHETISRFHAVMQFGKDGKTFIYDAGSTESHKENTLCNTIKLKQYTEIHVGDVIRFGESSRLYIFRGPPELIYPVEADKITLQTCKGIETPSKTVKRMDKMTYSGADSVSDTQQLVCNEKRQFFTPQPKSLSKDTGRKVLSVGSKRSASTTYEKEINCQRALSYHDCSGSKVTMDEYATYGISKDVKVPFMPNKVKMAKEDMKLVFLNAFTSVIDLHCEGLSLKGKFSSKNFMITLATKRVNLHGIEPRAYCRGDSTLDKCAFIRMIKEMAGDELTEDINIWLHCIENGGHNSVLKKHINMQHSNSIFGEFCIMYHALLEMRKLDKSRFKTILRRLSCYDDWVESLFSWPTLEDNRNYKDPSETQHYIKDTEEDLKESVFGLVQQIRNCWAHPAKAYKHFLIAVIICDYPCLLSDLQEAMFDLGYLPHLDTKKMLSQDEQKT